MKRRSFLRGTAAASVAAAGTGLVTTLKGEEAQALELFNRKEKHEVCLYTGDIDPAGQIIKNLEQLQFIHHGFPVNQLEHALQTATLARRAGMDREFVVASLCHDMAKTISPLGHEIMAAEMLKPYVREEIYLMMKYHGIFQGRFFWQHIGRDPQVFERYRREKWFDLASEFTRDFDAPAFKPEGQADPLVSFHDDIKDLVKVARAKMPAGGQS